MLKECEETEARRRRGKSRRNNRVDEVKYPNVKYTDGEKVEGKGRTEKEGDKKRVDE
jgi:hypothetical protein